MPTYALSTPSIPAGSSDSAVSRPLAHLSEAIAQRERQDRENNNNNCNSNNNDCTNNNDTNPPSCDGVVCCLGCLSIVPGFRRKIVSKIAFFPPSPAGYYVDATSTGGPGAAAGGMGTGTRTSNVNVSNRIWLASMVRRRVSENVNGLPSCVVQTTESQSETAGPGAANGLTSNGVPGPRNNPQLQFQPLNVEELRRESGLRVDAIRLRTAVGNGIWCFYLRLLSEPTRTHSKQRRRTMLFAHGNSTDMGYSFRNLKDLALKTDCDVFAFDYSGYGQSTSSYDFSSNHSHSQSTAMGPRAQHPLQPPVQPSEANIYLDIQACYYYLTEDVGLAASSIILYGQSVGSAAVLDLASQLTEKNRMVGGVILHSPLKSGLSVVHPGYRNYTGSGLTKEGEMKSESGPGNGSGNPAANPNHPLNPNRSSNNSLSGSSIFSTLSNLILGGVVSTCSGLSADDARMNSDSGLDSDMDFSNEQQLPWFDVFTNLSKIRLVPTEVPVFFIHGTADNEVSFDHSLALYDAYLGSRRRRRGGERKLKSTY